jgi:hypothetical protein
MFSFYCPTCDLSFLSWTRSLVSLRNSSDGPIGFLRCPNGHFNAVRFHKPRRSGADGVVRGERGTGRVAYLRGRPASEWVAAVSKRRPTSEHPGLERASA